MITPRYVHLYYECINALFDASFEDTMLATRFRDIQELALGYRVVMR